jgi:hypothetical protein
VGEVHGSIMDLLQMLTDEKEEHVAIIRALLDKLEAPNAPAGPTVTNPTMDAVTGEEAVNETNAIIVD